jgi:hypothetical protein
VTDMTSLPKATLDGLQSFIQTEQFPLSIIWTCISGGAYIDGWTCTSILCTAMILTTCSMSRTRTR